MTHLLGNHKTSSKFHAAGPNVIDVGLRAGMPVLKHPLLLGLALKDNPVKGTSAIVRPAMSDRRGELDAFLGSSSPDQRSINCSKPSLCEQMRKPSPKPACSRRAASGRDGVPDHIRSDNGKRLTRCYSSGGGHTVPWAIARRRRRRGSPVRSHGVLLSKRKGLVYWRVKS